MIDFTKPVRTKDGQPVEIFTTTARGAFPVVGQLKNGDHYPWRWTAAGHFLTDGSHSKMDLENVPEKRRLEGWMNVYPGGQAFLHHTKHSADFNSSPHRIACVYIDVEYEVGQGLEGGK